MCYLVNDTGILGKRKRECSYQESNLRPSDYYSSEALPLSYRRLVKELRPFSVQTCDICKLRMLQDLTENNLDECKRKSVLCSKHVD